MVWACREKSSCWYCVMTMTANRTVNVQDKTENPTFQCTLSVYELLPSWNSNKSIHQSKLSTKKKRRYLWSTTKPKLNYRKTRNGRKCNGVSRVNEAVPVWASEGSLLWAQAENGIAGPCRCFVKGLFSCASLRPLAFTIAPFPDPRASMSKLPCTRIQ